jgi:hypothetical protein
MLDLKADWYRAYGAAGAEARGAAMTVLLTTMAQAIDWQAVEQCHGEALVACARANGATRYRLYRNVRDATQVLLVAELPDDDAARDLVRETGTRLGGLIVGGVPDDRLWEAIGTTGIG